MEVSVLKSVFILALAQGCLLSGQLVPYDTLNGEGEFATSLGGDRYVAQKFGAGAETFEIDYVELELSLTGSGGAPRVEIWSDHMFNFPNALVGSLSADEVVSETKVYSFSPNETISLEGGKEYWVVVRGVEGVAETYQFRWWYLGQHDQGLGDGFLNNYAITNDGASSWSLSTGWPYMLKITGKGDTTVEDAFAVDGWTWNGLFPWVYSQENGWMYYLPTNEGIWIKNKSTEEWILKK